MTPTPTHIRTLFLHPKPTYAIGEAATLLEMDWRDLRGWMESGEVEGIETDEGLMLPWGELVSFGMEFWSQEVVEEALGAELAEALPELLRLTDLEVRIPRWEVVALERLAALDGETVSAVLARELRDLVSVHSEWLSQQVPGFAEALAWPETPLVASPRGGGAAGAQGAKQAASGGESRRRTPRRSDDVGPKRQAAMFSAAAHRMTATDVDAVIH
ncbi:MAG TPA: hypothetical protein VE010_00235 [Thermoanaerobaculia bacterium]|nr:hypothetical protein [Thermoanaerobaculia bacterium]